MDLSESHYNTFFEAVKQGSVDEIREFLEINGFEETCKLANSFNKHGETPLLLAIGGNHKAMVKFLINNLNVHIHQFGRFMWKGVEYLAAPPLFAAIISLRGQPTFSWCPSSIVDVLIKKEMRSLDNRFPFYWNFVQSNLITRRQKIDILELLGAAYLLNFYDFFEHKDDAGRGRGYGLEYWVWAMRLRELTNDGEPAFPKVPYQVSEFARKVFDDTDEFTTLEQLQEISTSPPHLLQDQALLISHRILNQFDTDPHPFFICRILDRRLPLLCENQQSRRVFNIALLILEVIETPTRAKWKDQVHLLPYFDIITRTMGFLARSFDEMEEEPLNDRDQEDRISFDRSFANIMKIINFISDYFIKLNLHIGDNLINNIEEALSSIYCLVLTLTEISPPLSHEENQQFSTWLDRFIRITNGFSDVPSLLHFGCHCNPTEKIDLVKLFLEAGANPNAKDYRGDLPFIYLIRSLNHSNVTTFVQKAQLLVDAGAHLDLVTSNSLNPEGHSLLDFLKKRAVIMNCPILQSFINKNVPLLTCLCAQALRRNQIPFDGQQIPGTLVSFLKNHGVDSLSQPPT